MITIRPVTPADQAAWLTLRLGLWPATAVSQHQAEIERFWSGHAPEPAAVLLAVTSDNPPVGFVELSLRAYAEGCDTSPVAFVEGWYVVPTWRRRGVGRSLIEAAAAWGRSQGCTELASDTEVDNDLSRVAHGAIGFAEVGVIRCFRKPL